MGKVDDAVKRIAECIGQQISPARLTAQQALDVLETVANDIESIADGLRSDIAAGDGP